METCEIDEECNSEIKYSMTSRRHHGEINMYGNEGLTSLVCGGELSASNNKHTMPAVITKEQSSAKCPVQWTNIEITVKIEMQESQLCLCLATNK